MFLRIQNYVLSLKPNQDNRKRLMIRETNRTMFDEGLKEISRVQSIAGYVVDTSSKEFKPSFQ